jgi:hypothetical protein
MDMAMPPVVADLPMEVASGWVLNDGVLLDDDVIVVGMCFMIKTLL